MALRNTAIYLVKSTSTKTSNSRSNGRATTDVPHALPLARRYLCNSGGRTTRKTILLPFAALLTYETTPDGREGWLNFFVKRRWDVYNSDAVERGRAGWAMTPDIFKGEPVFLAKANPFERFRIGQSLGSWSPDPAQRKLMPNLQFPVEAYDNFVKQSVPRWTTTDDAIIRAYTALVDKVCPCVILFHSQAGQFGFKVAQARPDKVKALVAVEPAGVGDAKRAAALKDIPTLVVFGDNIALDSRWPQIRKNGVDFVGEISKAGGKVEILDLPNAGIRGNSHMLMMDRNNLQVAALIQQWLEKQGLVRSEEHTSELQSRR